MSPDLHLSVIFLLALLGGALAIDLRISRDLSLTPSQHAYSSKCTLNAEPTDDQFLKMIQVAFDNMERPGGQERSATQKRKLPGAMIGLAIGKEVYFSSSVKSPTGVIYRVAPWTAQDGELNPKIPEKFKVVTDALAECATEGYKRHKNSASCGEIMSTLLWMNANPDRDPRLERFRVAAFYKGGYLPPCGLQDDGTVLDSWGCGSWVPKMGYDVVADQALPAQLTVEGTCEGPLSLNVCLTTPAADDNETGVGSGL